MLVYMFIQIGEISVYCISDFGRRQAGIFADCSLHKSAKKD